MPTEPRTQERVATYASFARTTSLETSIQRVARPAVAVSRLSLRFTSRAKVWHNSVLDTSSSALHSTRVFFVAMLCIQMRLMETQCGVAGLEYLKARFTNVTYCALDLYTEPG